MFFVIFKELSQVLSRSDLLLFLLPCATVLITMWINLSFLFPDKPPPHDTRKKKKSSLLLDMARIMLLGSTRVVALIECIIDADGAKATSKLALMMKRLSCQGPICYGQNTDVRAARARNSRWERCSKSGTLISAKIIHIVVLCYICFICKSDK